MALTTTCPMDCPDSCALEVEVQDGRVQTIRGGHDHPNTAGFICSKVAHFRRRLEHPDRLLYPMRRTGEKGEGRFARISWDEAIGEIAERFQDIRQQWGGEAIVPFHYGGSNGLLTDGLMDALFFDRIGASGLDLTICAVPTTEVAQGMYGRIPGVAFEDFPQARCIIIWGANPKASNIHLVPYLRQAKRNGAFIATVDPRDNFSANEVDLHLPVRPGTDLATGFGHDRSLAMGRALGYRVPRPAHLWPGGAVCRGREVVLGPGCRGDRRGRGGDRVGWLAPSLRLNRP